MVHAGAMPPAGRRILMLATDAFGGNGGIATYNRDAARALCEDADTCEVVLLPRFVTRPLEPLPDKLTHDLSGLGGGRRYLAAVLRHLRHGQFDLVYCAHVNLAPIAWLFARLRQIPWLLAIYGIEAWQPSPRRAVRAAVRHADAVLSISEVTFERFGVFAPYPAERRRLHPNAIHLEQYAGAGDADGYRRTLGLEGKKVLLTLGRMEASERYKGFDEILDLMPGLLSEVPDLVYLAAGDGNDRARLIEKAAALGLGDQVRFPGFVDEARKADLYRIADAYAMPSYGEGFGFVFLEAMACGTPVVASALDGGREAVLGGKLGRMVDPHDPVALRAALIEALAQPRGIPSGLDHFAWPGFARRMQETIAALAPVRKAFRA